MKRSSIFFQLRSGEDRGVRKSHARKPCFWQVFLATVEGNEAPRNNRIASPRELAPKSEAFRSSNPVPPAFSVLQMVVLRGHDDVVRHSVSHRATPQRA